MSNRRSGETREYGFAILPDRSLDHRNPNLNARFSVIQGDLNDPYLPTWNKTLTWFTEPKWWRLEMDKRRTRKILELPIVISGGWNSNDHSRISPAALSTLKSKLIRYFQADPQVLLGAGHRRKS